MSAFGTIVIGLQNFVDFGPSEGEVPELVRGTLGRLAGKATGQKLCLHALNKSS